MELVKNFQRLLKRSDVEFAPLNQTRWFCRPELQTCKSGEHAAARPARQADRVITIDNEIFVARFLFRRLARLVRARLCLLGRCKRVTENGLSVGGWQILEKQTRIHAIHIDLSAAVFWNLER